jgi:hypothetical protein
VEIELRFTKFKTSTPPGTIREIAGVVLHHTGTTRAVECHSQGSWHFIVDRDGTVYNDVDTNDIAWHTAYTNRWKPKWVDASAPWFTGSAINACSIGIEIVSHPDLPNFKGYTNAQLAALGELFRKLWVDHGDLWYVGHGQVQLDRRRTEPDDFPWDRYFLWDDNNGYRYVHDIGGNEDMTDTQRGILAAAERQGLKEEADIDQLVGRYNLLAEQVESLEHLLAEAQAERDAAIAAKEAADARD